MEAGKRLKPAPFEYVRATSVAGAVDCLQRFGEDAKLLAGGQSLIPMMALRLARPTALVDLGDLHDLRYIRSGETLALGALTTHAAVAKSDLVRSSHRMITEAVGVIGHEAIRNRGTIAGSMAHADPAAEWPTVAIALDAEIDVVGAQGARTISAGDFFISYFTTSLQDDEVIKEIRLKMTPGAGSAFLELARRPGDFGVAGVAAMIDQRGGRVHEARLGLMGVAETPWRARQAELMLSGQSLSAELLDAVAHEVESNVDPPGDVHASPEFRKNAARVLTARAVKKAWERSRNGETSD